MGQCLRREHQCPRQKPSSAAVASEPTCYRTPENNSGVATSPAPVPHIPSQTPQPTGAPFAVAVGSSGAMMAGNGNSPASPPSSQHQQHHQAPPRQRSGSTSSADKYSVSRPIGSSAVTTNHHHRAYPTTPAQSSVTAPPAPPPPPPPVQSSHHAPGTTVASSGSSASSSYSATTESQYPRREDGSLILERTSAWISNSLGSRAPVVSSGTELGPGEPARGLSLGSSMYGSASQRLALFSDNGSGIIDNLVQETLLIIRTLVDSNSAPPEAMLHLHRIADHESGWLAIAYSMIRNITTEDPLGPAVITLILDECPLPAKDTVMQLSRKLDVSREKAAGVNANHEPIIQRNVCILYGCLAEKLAGPTSVALLSEQVLDYLMENLLPDKHPSVILHALIALEKFALASENKATILRRLSSMAEAPFDSLEKWCSEEGDLVKREVGFCSQWNQDNLFVKPDRRFTYERMDNSHVNAMLNTNDTSEYLKLSADGLEARSDVLSFESVRCTFPVVKGAWYYEVTVVTCGIMQIGWASKHSKFLNHDGYGIGDDEYSIAYDGCRQLIWYRASCQTHSHRCWKPGDVLGCFIDIENRVISFSLNGDPVRLPSAEKSLFENVTGTNLYAAASFMSFQQCIFNFGAKPFKYAPIASPFSTFNDKGDLSVHSRTVYPRHKRLEMLRMISFHDDCCSLCYDEKSDTRLQPCGHGGFCHVCARQIEVCPLCRQTIQRTEVSLLSPSTSPGVDNSSPAV